MKTEVNVRENFCIKQHQSFELTKYTSRISKDKYISIKNVLEYEGIFKVSKHKPTEHAGAPFDFLTLICKYSK
jgi:hypothetical protein